MRNFVDETNGIDDHHLVAGGQPQRANRWVQGREQLVFNENSGESNNFDLQLGRDSDLNGTIYTTFAIGEHLADREDVTQSTKLDTFAAVERWSVAMDGMTVNGVPVQFNASSFSGTPPGKVLAALDSGTSLALIPDGAVQAIYSSIPGAIYSGDGTWAVPCLGTTNVSFIFGYVPRYWCS